MTLTRHDRQSNAVTPAKAGVQGFPHQASAPMDSRFRGNDGRNVAGRDLKPGQRVRLR